MDAVFDLLPGTNWRWPVKDQSGTTRHQQDWLDVEAWYLLVEEALAQVGEAAVEALPEFVAARQLTEERLAEIARRSACAPEDVRQALADYLAVAELVKRREQAVEVSEAEARAFVAATHDEVTILLSELPADAVVSAAEQVPEDELQRVFEAYRDRPFDPDKGLIGYTMGPAIKVEYIGFAFQDVVDSLALPEGQTRADEARKLIDLAVEQLGRYLREPWKDAQTVDGFQVAPEAVRANGYWDAVGAWAREHARIPVRCGKTDWMTATSVRLEAPELGQKVRRAADGRQLKFPDFAFDVQGLVEAGTARSPERVLALHEPVPEPIAAYAAGRRTDAYFYRVVETRPAGVPSSWHKVRQHVERDARRLRALGRAKADAQRLAEAARQHGLRAAYEGLPELSTKYGAPATPRRLGPFTQRVKLGLQRAGMLEQASLPPRLESFRNAEPLARAAFALVADGSIGAGAPAKTDPVGTPNGVDGRPADSVPLPQAPRAVAAVGLEDDLAWVVIELVEYRPLPLEAAPDLRYIRDLLRIERQAEVRRQLLSREEVKRRAVEQRTP
ncbi:MAG TPA: hypothetical protein PKK06_04255 [Phycisphaerae bacterium]|nr:hypothetical protein [Phycisphaerae bacterium]HNU44846.1 hypothetical protein [Phycisphaerae bacterium]